MAWRCAECDNAYDEPPEACACGSDALEPDGSGRERFSLAAAQQRLLAPLTADRSLVSGNRYVAIAFRALLLATLLVAVIIAVLLLLG